MAVDDTLSGVAAGGTTSVSVLANDTLNAVSPPLPASVVLTLVGAPAGYTLNADGTLGVGSTVTSGTTTLTYQICEAAAPTNCDTASITVIVSPSPQNDAFSVQAGQTLSNSVATNDSLPPGSTFTVQGTPPAGLTFNADGSFTYAPLPATPSPVTFTYQACLPAPNVVCATASVTLNIATGTLLAGNDTLSGVAPGNTSAASVLANDSLNGVSPPAAANVLLTLVGAPAGFAITPTGTISVATGVSAGPTSLTYQICEAAAPGNCTTASVTVIVSPTPQNDAFSVQAGQTLSNSVASNDSMPAGSTGRCRACRRRA
ncbi:Ig-like domain-containing protein [Stenotrophomonas rhizophila]